MDASNMLKPLLARGELHLIGATTLDEYRKHTKKDAALERRFQPVMVGLVAEYPEDIRLVFRHFPISTTHPHARIAAEAAEAAGAQGQFWEMHNMRFTHQDGVNGLRYDGPRDRRSILTAIETQVPV